ncbi:MAG: cupin domain-containing protein [Acidimicrobiia bacterium]
MDRRTVRVVRADQLLILPDGQTVGMTREEAVSADGLWVGMVRTAPGMVSGWHHHGDYDTYAFVASGRGRIEFGEGGQEMVEATTGDFLHVPSRVIHRESNPAGDESVIVLFRVGSGEPVFNVSGPDG